MAVTGVEIKNRSEYDSGVSCGEFGPYERIDGIVFFGVDPENSANSRIVDLQYAPVGDDGLVNFSSDFVLLTPIKTQSSRLLVDVVNRGRKRAIPDFNMSSSTLTASSYIDPGDGFLFKNGYSVVSIGWQYDVYRSDSLLGMDPPILEIGGNPVSGSNLVEIRPNAHIKSTLLANRVHKPYIASSTDNSNAYMYVKDWEDGPQTEIPRNEWKFAKEQNGVVVPDPEHVYMKSGFNPGKIYSVVYEALNPVVAGSTLMSVRDIGSWIKYGGLDSPIKNPPAHAYAYGISQTGRLLRHYLYAGMNLDENNRQVYDGLIPHVAGGRRGDFNHRFAQPSQQSAPGFGHLYPFSDNPVADPYGRKTEGLQETQKNLGGLPKVIYTNTSAEYWRGDASLSHIDLEGHHDLDLPENTRSYLFSGTQHVPRELPQKKDPGPDGSLGLYGFNVIDFRPLLRAALCNLVAWVEEGKNPPESKVPRLDDATASTISEVLDIFDKSIGLETPDFLKMWRLRETDIGPEEEKGIAAYPVKEGRDYPSYVSSVDVDGNEIAGIRMPDVSVPLGTHTGWNPRDPITGSPDQIISMVGFTNFFGSSGKLPRKNDFRKFNTDRYDSKEIYLEMVAEAAKELVQNRYLLPEDVTVVLNKCSQQYDEAIFKGNEI